MGNALELKYLDMDGADRLQLSEAELEKYRIEKGDLIFARRAQEASGAGGCTLVPPLEEPTVFESSLIRVRLTDKATPRFYMQYFDGPVGGKSIKRIVTETTISGIATSDLLNLKIAVPPLGVQERIADILSAYDGYTRQLQDERIRLKETKRALMQDLLSGEVRTHDKDIDVLPEVKQHG